MSGPLLHFPTIDPVLVQIGPVSIRWYALAYIAGLAGAWWRARWMIADARLWRERPCTPAQRDDLLVWTAIGVVAGGRLGQVLLYEPGYYLAHVWEIPQVWRGGMSFHGGLTGAALALILLSAQSPSGSCPHSTSPVPRRPSGCSSGGWRTS